MRVRMTIVEVGITVGLIGFMLPLAAPWLIWEGQVGMAAGAAIALGGWIVYAIRAARRRKPPA